MRTTAIPDDPWVRIDVTHWEVAFRETSGSHRPEWLREPETNTEWLHKNTHIPLNGLEQGEDWSEFLATQVALALRVPVAEARMCYREGRRGSLSRSVVPEGRTHALFNGVVALQEANVQGYFPHSEEEKAIDPDRPGVKRPGHTLANIQFALQGLLPPDGFLGPDDSTAFDVFCGYLLLDALVANQDRHEDNWAVLRANLTGMEDRLSPSFDHASCLGYNLTDARRQHALAAQDSLEMFAERGLAKRMEYTGRAESLVALAVRGLDLCSPATKVWWIEQIEAIDPAVEEIFAKAAHADMKLSDQAAKFAHALLRLNLRRLRDAIHD